MYFSLRLTSCYYKDDVDGDGGLFDDDTVFGKLGLVLLLPLPIVTKKDPSILNWFKVTVRNSGRLTTPDSLFILSAALPVDRQFQVRLCTSTYCLLEQNLTCNSPSTSQAIGRLNVLNCLRTRGDFQNLCTADFTCV